MKLWVLACLLACLVAAWAPAVHAQGVTEDCCLAYRTRRPPHRNHVRGYYIQEVTGGCNRPAVVFVFPRRLVCGNPKDKWVKEWVAHLDKQREARSCHGRRKLAAGPCAKTAASKPGGPSTNSTRSAPTQRTVSPGQ